MAYMTLDALTQYFKGALMYQASPDFIYQDLLEKGEVEPCPVPVTQKAIEAIYSLVNYNEKDYFYSAFLIELERHDSSPENKQLAYWLRDVFQDFHAR